MIEGYRNPIWARDHPIRPQDHAVDVVKAIAAEGARQTPASDGYKIWVAIGSRKIARQLGISRRRVIATLDALIEVGVLERRRVQVGASKSWTNAYRIYATPKKG